MGGGEGAQVQAYDGAGDPGGVRWHHDPYKAKDQM